LAVLWATHLMDEVYDTDKLVVIHQGSLRAQGTKEDIMRKAEVDNLNDAFFNLTQGKN